MGKAYASKAAGMPPVACICDSLTHIPNPIKTRTIDTCTPDSWIPIHPGRHPGPPGSHPSQVESFSSLRLCARYCRIVSKVQIVAAPTR
jgi:hypothetical protein